MKPRIVYIANISEGYYDVAFDCPIGEFPYGTSGARRYEHITRSSLKRLNHLVYLPAVPLEITAHLVPFANLWVTFPPKAAPAPVRPITRHPSYTPKGSKS